MDWHNTVPSLHSWDAADAARWGDPDIVSMIPDRGTSGLSAPLQADKPEWGWSNVAYANPTGPLSGPRWIEHASEFGGRPAVDFYRLPNDFDGWVTGPAHGFLSTSGPIPGNEGFNYGIGYQQQWWVAALVRIPPIKGGIVDGDRGSLTLAAWDYPPYNLGATTEFGDPWPRINWPVKAGRTFLAVAIGAGGASRIRLTWRKSNLKLTVAEFSVTLDDQVGEENFTNLHSGGHVTSLTSAWKLSTGAISENDLLTLDKEVAPYLVPEVD